MTPHQPIDFGLIPTNIFVPKILPGVLGYSGECRYSSIRCEDDLSDAILEDAYTANTIDLITWLAYVTHGAIFRELSGEMALGLFTFEEDCFLFDWVECRVYLGEQQDARALLDHIRDGWLLPSNRRVPRSVGHKLENCVDQQESLLGLLRLTLDQRLRLN